MKSFLIGAATAPLYTSKMGFIQHLSVSNAEMGFYATMSLAFLAASFTSPSWHFKLAEIAIFLLCAFAAHYRHEEVKSELTSYLGAATADLVGRMSPEDRKLLADVFLALGTLSGQTFSPPLDNAAKPPQAQAQKAPG
ncbi:MAG TPA: hypothetical protein VJW20_15040 [Candidatus Angelobacter sp.]|nr:hypothetical protein [Candidatus Angelobacter sp.]